MSVQSIIQLLGGVGLFLFAIKLISEALQLIAGDRLRQLIGTLTKTPIMGVLVGACVTVLIQSSSATMVMTVSFVDAGLMTLTQAIGVIMGANIGTTITGQILAIKVQDYAYLFIIIGVLLSFFGRSKVQKYAGNGLLGFGLLFVGMQTMESSMSFLRNEKELFLMFSHNPLMGVLAGTLLTLLVQSSAATVGLTIALGVQGLLPLHAAIPIILGDNIGTTITAVLASIGTDRTAKQACAAHVLFNVIGVCIFLTILPLYQELIAMTATGIAHQIANAHTLFNVFNTIIFLPFVKPFAALIRRLLPDKAHKVVEGAQYLDPKLIEATPGIAVEAVKNECAYMGFLVIHLLDSVQEVFFNDKKDLIPKIEETEAKIDQLHKAVKAYAEDIMQAGISDDAARVLTLYVASSGNIERIGDYGKKLLLRVPPEQAEGFLPAGHDGTLRHVRRSPSRHCDRAGRLHQRRPRQGARSRPHRREAARPRSRTPQPPHPAAGQAGMRLRNGPCLCGYSRDHRAHRLSFEQRRQGHHFLLHGGAQGEGVTDTEKEAFSKKPLPTKTATGRPRGKSSAAKRLCMNTHAEPFSTTYCDHERAFPYCRLPLLEIFSWLVQSVQFISHPLEKLQRRKAKGFTDGIDRGDGGIPFSFYDSTDIAILQIRKGREGRFGHLSFFSDFFRL